VTIHGLLRLFPRAWRDRYGDEFVDVVGQRPLSVQQAVDILMGAIDAWLSRSVRAGVRASAATVTSGGGVKMIQQLKMRCAGAQPRYTTRDGLISAGVLLLGSVLLSGAGILFSRQDYPVMGDVLKSLAFPVAMTISMPFAILKGQPKKAVIFTMVVTLGLLFIATWIATQI
jgi:hypothetical protein